MRVLLATALILLASGCDSRDTEDFTLSLDGTILDASGQPLAEPDVLLVGNRLDIPGVIYILSRIEPDEAGGYTLDYDFPLFRVEEASGGCIAFVNENGTEVRLTMTAGDGLGGYASAVPECSEGRQRLDLVVEDFALRPEVAPGGIRTLTR